MQRYLEQTLTFFETPVDLRSRLMILLAALILIPILFLPLWHMQIYSSQFPDGLTVNIYAGKLESGGPEGRDDLLEINAINYFIGMEPLEQGNFVEFTWLPFALGATILLALRVIVLGKMSKLIDLLVFNIYVGAFAFWSFYSRLYDYGHQLNPDAQITVPPFTPPMFGSMSVAKFELAGSPGIGSYLMIVVPLVLIAAVCWSRRAWKREHMPSKDFVA